jgi:hypothetical protein
MMEKLGMITVLMLKHHAIVNKFLENFENVSDKTSEKARNLFKLFKWNLEKHLFIEEKNFFTVADKNNREELAQLNNLLKDHKDLGIIVNNLYEDLNQGMDISIKILKELLSAHEKREVESFYPRLDSRLPEKDKKELIQRANEIVLGKA